MVSLCSTVEHAIQICNTAVDWGATGDYWSGIGTIMGAGAVIFAAKKGASTFQQWKKQKLAERHIEQAERILTAVDNAKDGLAYVRGVALWSWEQQQATEKLAADDRWQHKTEDQRRRLVTAQAYLHRLEATKEQSNALNACRPMARAFFGEDIEKAITKLNHQFWIVQTYVNASIDDNGADEEFTTKIRRAMYDNSLEGGSEISNAIVESIAIIDGKLLPILQQEEPKPEPKAGIWTRPVSKVLPKKSEQRSETEGA